MRRAATTLGMLRMAAVEGPILSAERVLEAQLVIDAANPGLYTLKQLFAGKWVGGSDGQYYGIEFKAALKAGLLRRVAYNHDTSAHAAVYRVG